jgi:hypothetical protein
MIREKLFGARNWQKPLRSFFSLLTMIAQLRIGLEICNWPLEPSGNEDSEYVLKTFLACL